MRDLRRLNECCPMVPSSLSGVRKKVVTPLKWKVWDEYLASHPDQEYQSYIVTGLQRGFRIGFDYNQRKGCRKATSNMLSVMEKPEVVRDYLSKECAEGRVLGPLPPQMFPGVQISRIGVIPKGSSGKWRLIVDLSAPKGSSVNDNIDENLCSLSYISVEDAVEEIMARGQGSQLAKVDIQSAYRIIPVHPEDWRLLGMSWENSLFIDTTLPFGLRSAPKIFTAVADAAEWIAKQQGVTTILHYLDDYLVIGSPGSMECTANVAILLTTFDRLGIPVALNKLEGPSPVLTFLGIELDTVQGIMRLPPQKLQELQNLIGMWVEKKSCYKRDLESLVGKLQHACKVVKPGRTFLRRMFELLRGVAEKYHHIRLSNAFRSDLRWWHTFLNAWNGKAMMRAQNQWSPAVKVFTDASGEVGCGALWGSHWLQLKWADMATWKDIPITQKEVLPAVLACAVWGHQWRAKRVLLHCDNEAAVAVLNAGYSHDSLIMHLLRTLFFIKAHFDLDLRVTHIPGKDNGVADAISRDDLVTMFSQVPTAARNPSPIPPGVSAVLVEGQPDWTSVDWVQLFASCFQED